MQTDQVRSTPIHPFPAGVFLRESLASTGDDSAVRRAALDYLDCLVNGDSDRLRGLLAPSCTLVSRGKLPWSGGFAGADAIIERQDAGAAGLETIGNRGRLRVTVEAVHSTGDLAAVEITTSGSRQGDGFSVSACVVVQATDEGITRIQEYFDTRSQQLFLDSLSAHV